MTQFAFDLISDLHVQSWPEFDWTGQATSPYCLVVGDVADNHKAVAKVLTNLAKNYRGVFYIDGNDEHRNHLDHLEDSYESLFHHVRHIPNVVFLQDNCVIVDGVAILATNGWWTYDFDSKIDFTTSIDWLSSFYRENELTIANLNKVAYQDAGYMIKSVAKLQTHCDVKAIILASHTVPGSWLIEHDLDLVDTPRFNCMGNRYIDQALLEDSEGKIKTWCFGHYHKDVDMMRNDIRFVNNCRGRGDTQWGKTVYFPKRIVIEY